jgi:hypothetical protein
MKLKKFTVIAVKECDRCGKKTKKEDISSIRVWSTTALNHYRGSGRKMVGTMSLKLCKRCFPVIWNKINNIVI